MVFDIAEGQAISRLTGTLERTFAAYANYLRSVGNEEGARAYVLLATAIATGIIPYIDGRDDILDKKITVERLRNDQQDQVLVNHEQRILNLENQIGQFRSLISGLESKLANLKLTGGTTTTTVAAPVLNSYEQQDANNAAIAAAQVKVQQDQYAVYVAEQYRLVAEQRAAATLQAARDREAAIAAANQIP